MLKKRELRLEIGKDVPTDSCFQSNDEVDCIRERWETLIYSFDLHVSKFGKTTYYVEDSNSFPDLLTIVENAKLMRYADTIFVVKMSDNLIPIEAYAVVRGYSSMKIKTVS